MDEQTQSRDAQIHKYVEKIRQANLLNDSFASIALEDIGACQYVLRTILGIEDLKVIEAKGQYRLLNMTSKDAILDVFAEDSKGRLMNIEIQRRDTVDHAHRTRFYASQLDKVVLDKGANYNEMPDVYIIYISETDIWHMGKTVYRVRKTLDDTNVPYDDGSHVIYINTAVDDGSEIARLMSFFKTADPNDMTHGDLSQRVRNLKIEEGGYDIMCDEAKELVDFAIKESLLESIKALMSNLKISAEQAMQALNIPASEQAKYLALL